MAKVSERRLIITDSFMFDRVMRDERLCAGLLERVLGLPVGRIVYRNSEQVIDPLADAKGIQLDLYPQDESRVYDVEMQVQKRSELPKRLRYYQSMIDADLLPKGASYGRLRESCVIFLCAHDPFDDGLPVYTIERTCLESGRVIETCAHWLALNCRAYARADSEPMRNPLEYLENGRVAQDDELLCAMDAAVIRANSDRKWVGKVLSVNTIYDDARYEGLMDGRAEGLAEGRAEGEARLSELMRMLFEAGRLDDAQRAASDPSYRDRLFGELGIA